MSMSKNYRDYESADEIAVGDTVTFRTDAGNPSAFTCCIVTGWNEDNQTFIVTRPHAKVGDLLHTSSGHPGGSLSAITQAYIACEVFTVPKELVLRDFVVHVTGPSMHKDNRHFNWQKVSQ